MTAKTKRRATPKQRQPKRAGPDPWKDRPPEAPPRVWQQACDDIVASAVHHVLRRDVGRLLYSREVIARYSAINKSIKVHERAARSTVLGCMELARKNFPAKGHSRSCRCRAYAILAVNAQYACQDDPGRMEALFSDMRAKLDEYLARRN